MVPENMEWNIHSALERKINLTHLQHEADLEDYAK
jgi:hypothetical protein